MLLLLFNPGRIIGFLPVTDTDILHKPVNVALAGEQLVKDRYREWDVPQARKTETTKVTRSGVRGLSPNKPSFTTRTDKRGYD